MSCCMFSGTTTKKKVMIKTPSEDMVDGLPPASTSGCSLKRQVTLGAEAPELFANGSVLPNKKKIKPTVARQKSRPGTGAIYIPAKDYWPVNLVRIQLVVFDVVLKTDFSVNMILKVIREIVSISLES